MKVCIGGHPQIVPAGGWHEYQLTNQEGGWQVLGMKKEKPCMEVKKKDKPTLNPRASVENGDGVSLLRASSTADVQTDVVMKCAAAARPEDEEGRTESAVDKEMFSRDPAETSQGRISVSTDT